MGWGQFVLFAAGLLLPGCFSGPASSPQPSASATPAPFNGTISYAAFGSDGYTHVYLLSGSGGAPVQLTSGAHNDETPEWSPDGSKLVFQRSDSNGLGVHVMNADGTGLTRLSPIPGADSLPAFSSDGTKVVFATVVSQNSCNGGAMPTTSVLTMSATNGSSRTTVVDGTHAATCFNVEPRMSPDGKKIAYMCAPSGNAIQACTVNSDGTGSIAITHESNTVGDPHWSWNSQKLAISHKDASGNVNVWTMNADGSSLTQITHFTEPVEGGDAGWSLDNSQLAFEQDTGGNGQSDANAPAGVSIIGADGTNYGSLGVSCSDIGCSPRFRP